MVKKKIVATKEKRESNRGLTARQELFCIHYVKNDELRMNATMCYNEAGDLGLHVKDRTRLKNLKGEEIIGSSEYDKCYNICSALGSQTLRSLKVQDRIRELWNEIMKDANVDARLSQLILTGKDEVSINAIKEYNKMNSRIIERVEHSGKIQVDTKQIETLTDEQLQQLIKSKLK